MIQVNIDTQHLVGELSEKFGMLLNVQDLMLQAAVAVMPHMKVRVHQDGLDSNGQPIGTYSDSYMKVRTGIYGNSARYKRGGKKGTVKDSGVYSKGKHKGSPRPKYNRSADTKVILSLTRQMENDMIVIPTEKGYGIGYSNEHNYDKALWCEATYDKQILTALTKEEEAIAQDALDEYLTAIIEA